MVKSAFGSLEQFFCPFARVQVRRRGEQLQPEQSTELAVARPRSLGRRLTSLMVWYEKVRSRVRPPLELRATSTAAQYGTDAGLRPDVRSATTCMVALLEGRHASELSIGRANASRYEILARTRRETASNDGHLVGRRILGRRISQQQQQEKTAGRSFVI